MFFVLPGLRRPSRFQSFVFLSAFIASASLAFSQSTDSNASKIINFGQVNENYYRGGQPTVSDFRTLKRMGVKTVIDLQKDGNFQEASWVQDAGMQYHKIPLKSTHPANAEQTQYFLKLVNDPVNWPVYVHCAGGRHRTGEMTAIYRITKDSWNADQAFTEMKRYGYYSFPNHGSLKKYVYSYYKDFVSTAKKDTPATKPANAVPISAPAPTPAPTVHVD